MNFPSRFCSEEVDSTFSFPTKKIPPPTLSGKSFVRFTDPLFPNNEYSLNLYTTMTSTSNVSFGFSLPPVVSPNLRFLANLQGLRISPSVEIWRLQSSRSLQNLGHFQPASGVKMFGGWLAAVKNNTVSAVCFCRWKHKEVLASIYSYFDNASTLGQTFVVFFCVDVSEDGTMIRQVDWQRAI